VPFAWSPGWNSPQAWNKFQDEVGGHLRAGDPGIRLLDAPRQSLGWFAVPGAFAPGATFSVVPLYHLYGSDELSARAEAVRTRIEAPYALLAAEDAERLGVQPGAPLKLTLDGETLRLTAQLSEAFTPGLIGLPHNLPGLPAFRPASTATLEVAQ